MAATTEKMVPKRDEVKLTKASGKRTHPTKQTLNLMIREKKTLDPAKWIPGVAIVLVAAALIGKFAVADRFARLNRAEAELSAKIQTLEDTRAAYADFDQVQDRYNHFTYTGFDRSIADRLVVLDILEKHVYPVCDVQSIAISGRTVNITVTDLSNSEASALKVALEGEELVNKFFVTSASHEVQVLNGEATISIDLVDASTVEGGSQS